MVLNKRNIIIFTFVLFLICSLVYAKEARILVSKNPADIYFQLGKESYNEKNYEESLEFFKKSIELNQDYYQAYHNLAQVYYRLGDVNNAILNLNNAIKINQEYIQGYYSLALVYYEQKEFDESIINLKKVIEYEPNNPNAHFDIAIMYVDRFRIKESKGLISADDLKLLESALYHYKTLSTIDLEFPNANNNALIVGKIYQEYNNFFK